MALRYEIDRIQQLVTITGEYSDAAEWEDLFRRVQAEPSSATCAAPARR